MIEWAVFLAIFLPAADVAEGCFLFGELGFAEEDADEGTFVSSFGFIWMIFLARLGGGGRSSFALPLPDSVLLRCITGDKGGERL